MRQQSIHVSMQELLAEADVFLFDFGGLTAPPFIDLGSTE